MASDIKITRSIRLTPDVDARLIALCEHFGISIHNYLTNEIGKAVSRDEVALKAKQSQADAFEKMMSQFALMISEQENKDQ